MSNDSSNELREAQAAVEAARRALMRFQTFEYEFPQGKKATLNMADHRLVSMDDVLKALLPEDEDYRKKLVSEMVAKCNQLHDMDFRDVIDNTGFAFGENGEERLFIAFHKLSDYLMAWCPVGTPESVWVHFRDINGELLEATFRMAKRPYLKALKKATKRELACRQNDATGFEAENCSNRLKRLREECATDWVGEARMKARMTQGVFKKRRLFL